MVLVCAITREPSVEAYWSGMTYVRSGAHLTRRQSVQARMASTSHGRHSRALLKWYIASSDATPLIFYRILDVTSGVALTMTRDASPIYAAQRTFQA